MFEQTFVNSQGRTRKPWTVGASLAIQAVAVLAVLIVPLLHIAALEMPRRDLPLMVSLRPLTPAPPQAVHTAVEMHAAPRIFRSPLLAPTRVPPRVDMTPDAPSLAPVIMAGAAASRGGVDVIPGIVDVLPTYAPPKPAPTRDAPVAPHAPIRVSTGVQQANLISSPRPVYPPLAKAARVQGTVRIQAIIAADGSIKNLQLLGGPPLLAKAAMDAVRRWQYKPTLLNGSPVEVITDIDVNFTLN